jgi:hypothetical protein
MGSNSFIIQVDNKTLVKTMKNGGFLANVAAAIFFHCNILALGFSKVSYEYCPREENLVAQELAKKIQALSSSTWDDDPLALF